MAAKKQETKAQEIVDNLIVSYNMELETVLNYLANSIMLDGIRAREIREVLVQEVQEELLHGQRLGERIKELDGRLPGSQGLKWEQDGLQVPDKLTDIVSVIRGVIEAEEGAIAQYRKVIKLSEEAEDYVTQDLCTELMADEESHRRLFVGFLKELESG